MGSCWRFVLERTEPVAPGATGSDGRCDIQQLVGLERGADLGALGQGADIVDAAHMQSGPQPRELERLDGGRLPPAGFLQPRRWHKR